MPLCVKQLLVYFSKEFTVCVSFQGITDRCLLLVGNVFIWSVIYRVLIATQHFLKSSALVESMYSGMSHHEKYFNLLQNCTFLYLE